VGSLLCRLYELCLSKACHRGGDRIAEGHRFEDETAEQVYHFAREAGLDPNPPRMTLDLPTRSGNLHQFDASFRRGNEIFVVECKNTREAAKDYLYYFYAKIMDYLHAWVPERGLFLRGIFLSTVPVADSAWRYGLAYGIRIVDPDSPPPEYMLRCQIQRSLESGLRGLLVRMEELAEGYDHVKGAPKVLEEYRFLCGRWRDG
jgi:hypothetical protein